ncbi:hypothetical protein ACJMK2_037388, partial [Sinanodonta woodiana]
MSSENFIVTSGRDGTRRFVSEHDDRWVRGGSRQSGKRGWKNRNNSGKFRKDFDGRGRGRGRGRGNFRGSFQGSGSHSHQDEDGDSAMDGEDRSGAQKRFSPYSRPDIQRRMQRHFDPDHPSTSEDQRPGSFQHTGLPVSTDSDSEWYKILIPYGKKSGKFHLLKLLQSHLNVPFKPFHFHFEHLKAVFYIQDKVCADAIKVLSKKVIMPNGYKLIVIVRPSAPPYIPMSDESIEKLKVCMSSRYDPASKALDLSNLYNDTEMRSENLYMALNREEVMSSVMKIIEDNIPEIVALDVSNNKLLSLDYFAALTGKAPNITRLNLGKNKLRSLDELDKIRGWTLEVLILDGNELCDKFKDQSGYISAVRQKFPKIQTLDGHELPPPITFDIESSTELPRIKGDFFAGIAEVQLLLIKFLKDYFTIYDSDNRQGLVIAYHEQAMFSLSACYNGLIEFRQPSLNMYAEESRNLIRLNRKDPSRKNKLLKYGRLPVITQLCLLPKTTHDSNSFVVDVGFVSASLLSFTVCGMFKEGESKADRPQIRWFTRSFLTVPYGQG